MPDHPPPKVRSRFPSSRYFNSLAQLFESLGLIISPPLRLIPSGRATILTYDEPRPRIYARITSAQSGVDQSYNFLQVYRRPGHTWVDGTMTGKMWEQNNLATLAIGDRIRLTKDIGSPDWIGQLDHC
jgi:hypothetical protein